MIKFHSGAFVKREVIMLLGVLLMVILLSLSFSAQTTTSTIEGNITDPNGAVIPGVQVKAAGTTLAAERTTTTNSEGFYRLTALPAGVYTLTITQSGFAPSSVNLELTLNRVVTLDVPLQLAGVDRTTVTVTSEAALLNQETAASGITVTPRQIRDLPVNGRDYLDLLQLVPGTAVNRQADPGSDNATPVLGERGGNNNFLIDGQPNKDTVNGGAAAQFNQETIAEFQVLTAGYKAEFGQASGATVNVITKSGGNGFHGSGSLFYRNDALDASNSLDPTEDDAPTLRRFDYSIAGGGPIIKDRVFFFGSSERITETRQLNFNFPDLGNDPGGILVSNVLRNQEIPFDNPSRAEETRNFLKLDEKIGDHHLTQQVNYTNGLVREFLPLSLSGSLPSTRNDTGERHLLLGFSDTALLGDQADPWVLALRGAFRGEPSDSRPSHPEAGASTRFFPFSSNTTGTFTGDLPLVTFGNPLSASNLDQQYTSLSAHLAKHFGDHEIKFGWNFMRTKVDGVTAKILDTQLFVTVNDFATYGPINAGFFTLTTIGGLTPEANEIHLRNNYHGLFVQDDWKLRRDLTINLGLRWDYDSEFVTKKNFSPRLGVAWAVTPKTVIRGHFGVFYDQFRLGLASNVPAFGGADRRVVQPFSYPRGFYGVPTLIVALVNASLFPPNGVCVSPNLTDAEITAGGLTCPFGGPYIGIDRLNGVVAPGHAPIPANSVINVTNVQALSGLTPTEYADQASAAVGQPAGFFFWGPYGAITHGAVPAQPFPNSIDDSFATPHTLSFSVGIQREIGRDMVIEADYHHRLIHDLLGLRESNIAYAARVVGRSYNDPFPGGPINTFGPFYNGQYDALVLSFNKRFGNRFQFGVNYTFAKATDNSLGINTLPSDSYIGIVPQVTEAGTGKSNIDGPFTTVGGAFVAKAGTFSNGPDLDKGPSDLAQDQIFQVNGMIDLPWDVQISSIFRVQSGFHFSRNPAISEDPDGNGTFNSIDHGPGAGRNAFSAPPFVNLDMRFSKQFKIGDRVKIQAFLEFFNILNRQNPAAVEANAVAATNAFGKATQVLPGREGQLGFRIEF